MHPYKRLNDRILRFSALPSEKISQRRTPKDHTSLWLVYTLSKMLSGAIHFSGRRAWEGVKNSRWTGDKQRWHLSLTVIIMRMIKKNSGAVRCLSWRSRGLCICLWPGRSHRSSRCCSLTGECSGPPGLCGYTVDTHTYITILQTAVCMCVFVFCLSPCFLYCAEMIWSQ